MLARCPARHDPGSLKGRAQRPPSPDPVTLRLTGGWVWKDPTSPPGRVVVWRLVASACPVDRARGRGLRTKRLVTWRGKLSPSLVSLPSLLTRHGPARPWARTHTLSQCGPVRSNWLSFSIGPHLVALPFLPEQRPNLPFCCECLPSFVARCVVAGHAGGAF